MSSTSNIYLGNLNMEGAYLGDIPVDSIYLGENLVYSSGPFQGLKVTPSSMKFTYTGGTDTLKIKSSEPWFLSYDISKVQCNPWSGNSGETTVTVTASVNTGNTDITTVITGSTNSSTYTASTEVTINGNKSFPSVPYMFNYNAKEYNTSTNTFPKKQGQLFNEDLVLDGSPTDVSADCVSFVGSTVSMRKTYNTSSDNPFNRDSQNKELTIIYKASNFTGSEDNLIANRYYNYNFMYNYMVRGNKFHTLDASFLEMSPIGDPYIMLIRVQSDGSCERTQLDANGNTIQSVTSQTINYGTPSYEFNFFNGGSPGEYFNGCFYWMYLANNALSNFDVLTVINYNENL